MLNSWATRRKVIYGTAFVIVLALVVGIPMFLYLHKPPNCSDGSQNGNEEGVDCGGSCMNLCQNRQAFPITLWTQKFEVSPGIYSAIAYIENPNVGAYALNAEYTFTFRDDSGQIIATRDGSGYIPPHKIFAAFESGITVGANKAARVEFSFKKAPYWQRATTEEPRISVVSKVLTREDTSPRVDATLQNTSIYNLYKVEATAIIYEANGNAVGASRTYVDEMPKAETRNIVFTWPNRFPTESAACDAPVDVVLLIDRSGSMASDGSNPPQPLTDVKNAAAEFVDNITAQDQGSVISFATTPSSVPDFDLSSKLADLKAAIGKISIGQEGTQYTNIGDALVSAEKELESERANPDAKKDIVLLTDGVPTAPEHSDDADYPKKYAAQVANDIKGKQTDIYTIGLGKSVDGAFLSSLSSAPEKYFPAPNTDTLKGIYKQIAAAICRKAPTVIEIIPLVQPQQQQ